VEVRRLEHYSLRISLRIFSSFRFEDRALFGKAQLNSCSATISLLFPIFLRRMHLGSGAVPRNNRENLTGIHLCCLMMTSKWILTVEVVPFFFHFFSVLVGLDANYHRGL